ncbi:MAG: TVP38/TMEM64 family protein, partial [Planctomycetes bacterium]|nr:TVP38/TMEM64 family protein [Planctomycetota bacterium]
MEGAAFRRRALLLLAGAAVLVVLARQLPVEGVREWVRSLGAWGPAGLAALYLMAPVLLVP